MDEAKDPDSPLSITMVCAPARVGGLERVVQALASGLAARGHRVTVCAVVGAAADATPFLAPIEAAGVRTVPLELGAREYRRERRAVLALLKEAGADVLHTHGYRSDLLHGGPARRAGIATVSTVHGSSRMGGLSHFFEWIQPRALRAFDAVIPVSAPLRASLARVGVRDDRLHLLPNAVVARPDRASRDVARAGLALPRDGTPVVGWVGRLVEVKDAALYLHAVAAMPGGWIASVIGDGPDRAMLEALAERLGIASRVRFHGEVDDAARFLAAFDAYVLSSRSEGTPIAVLEAMQAGVPVIATAVGGVPDLLRDGAGWLVPPGDAPMLAAAIGEALADREGAAGRARIARERIAADFDQDRWAARHEQVYRAAIRRRTGAS